MVKRPAVMPLFHKNAHSYKKDYGVEVHTLGRQIMGWWSEISPRGGVPNIRFGGPTGVYSLVVLLSWWCTLLKARPSEEHVDCLRTLTDVDHALSVVIGDIENHSTTPTSMLSPTSPPPPSQPRKRANPGETSPRKRHRSARV